MSLSTVRIWQVLQDAGIASAGECRQWAGELLAIVGSGVIENPTLMLAELVKLGHLTEYQAKSVLANDVKTLAIARHLLLGPLASPALRDWFEAWDTSTNTARWLYAISESRLKEPAFDRHPPSLKLAGQHVGVKADGLQCFTPPAFIDGYLFIAATPIDGQPLREFLKSYPGALLPTETASNMIKQLAVALSALHQEGIVHGNIGIDQVWWAGQDDVRLLRDPLFPPVSPLGPMAPMAVGVADDQDDRVRYAAPEFTAPGQIPTFATDIYALGCLWWELLTGKSPYAETMLEQVPLAASRTPLVIPDRSNLTDGQRRCIEHMLAKNPGARFPDARQLVMALQAVINPMPAVQPPAASATKLSDETLMSRNPSKALPPAKPEGLAAVSERPSDQATAIGARVDKPKKATPTSPRRTAKKKARPIWLIPSMLAVCIALLAGLVGILTWNHNEPASKANVVSNQKSVVNETAPNPSSIVEEAKASAPATRSRIIDPIEDQYVITADDQSLPWVPPRASQPYSLVMLPPGAQGFIFVRPNAWLTNPSGQAVMQSLASFIEPLWKPIDKACGLPLDRIQEVAIGLYGGRSDGWPVMAYRIQLQEPTSYAKLQETFTNSTEHVIDDGRKLLVAGEQAIYLSPAEQGSEAKSQWLSIGPVAMIRELVEMDGGAPLRRQMEQLWQVSDAQSDLTLIINSGFIFSDARGVLPSISPRVQAICQELLDEKIQAFSLSTSLTPQWYGELRAIGKTNDDSVRFTKELQNRMKSIADRVESELVASPASPYWRAIAARFPQMLRALARYQRYGVENSQAISNFYLPTVASANIAVATWLSLLRPDGEATDATKVEQSPSPKKLTGDELLAHPVSINFEQEPLDSALALITEEVNRSLPIGSGPIQLSIDGKAFELASVTRNQQIRDFRFKDQPLRALLTDLASRVNPDRTVKSLDEVKQAVVWAMSDVDGQINIVFTTRRGIEGTDRKLPVEFTKP